MKVAIVHDYLTQYGGAERVLQVLCELFPKAPIYTLIYNEKATGGVFKGKEIITSFLQKVPGSKRFFRSLPFLMPLAIEQFDLSYYDLVISNSTSYAKGIITKPKTIHISYCPTPSRYLWHDTHESVTEFKFPRITRPFIPWFLSYLRIWDLDASQRVDEFIAASKITQNRIKRYYNRESTVIYPSIEIDKFNVSDKPKQYFLMVGRMVPYKRFDLVVDVFSDPKYGMQNEKLLIVGDGPERKKLDAMVRKTNCKNIEFLGLISDQRLPEYYTNAKALIFPQEEDFGIVALESMACGRPVIAYKAGGALETIINGKTGIFFDEQNPESLSRALSDFKDKSFNPQEIRQHATNWDKKIFKDKIIDFIKSKTDIQI